MPALPPAPWLNPPDYTGAYIHGAQIGTQAAEANARLQQAAMEHRAQIEMAQQKLLQDAQQEQMSLQVRQQMAQQKNLVEQQKMEVSKAYQNAQIGVRQQQLEEAKRMGDMKIKAASAKSLAELTINKGVEQWEQQHPGEDSTQVRMQLTAQNWGSMGGTTAGLPSLLGKMAPKPSLEARPIPGTGDYLDIGGRAFKKASPSKDPLIAAEVEILKRDIENLNKDRSVAVATKNKKEAQALQEEIDIKMKSLRDLFKDGASSTESSGAEKAVIINGRLVYMGKETQNLPELMGQLEPYAPQQIGLQGEGGDVLPPGQYSPGMAPYAPQQMGLQPDDETETPLSRAIYPSGM